MSEPYLTRREVVAVTGALAVAVTTQPWAAEFLAVRPDQPQLLPDLFTGEADAINLAEANIPSFNLVDGTVALAINENSQWVLVKLRATTWTLGFLGHVGVVWPRTSRGGPRLP